MMSRRSLIVLVPLAALLLVAVAAAQQYRRGGGRRDPSMGNPDRNGVPEWKNDERFKNDVFTFVRVRYSDGYGRRGGWGGYGLANASYFLDSNHNFRVGTTVQYIAGSTSGQAVANFPATKTTDHWFNLGFGLGFSF